MWSHQFTLNIVSVQLGMSPKYGSWSGAVGEPCLSSDAVWTLASVDIVQQ